jgi:hypothetical protein
MHSIVFLTALTATSGLFGGGRQCTARQYRAGFWAHRSAVRTTWTYAPCAQATAAPQAQVAAPAPAAAPVATAPRTAYYQSNYYYYPTTGTCPSGTCSRR